MTKAARQLVLLGSGRAHLHFLSTLAVHKLPEVQITLVSPSARQIVSDLVPALVAGHYRLENCALALEPLLRHTGVRWLQRQALRVHARHRTVILDDGTTLGYDWLSINTGALQDQAVLEQRMPGVREHGLFLRPSESFVTLWPRFAAMGDARALRIAVIGKGVEGFEIAMAVRHRFPQSAVTLITGATSPDADPLTPLQALLLDTLRANRITVLPDTVTALSGDAVELGCGAKLACDLPLIATGLQPPLWLQDSELALDAQGFLAVDLTLRSTSHCEVFAAGDVCSLVDTQSQSRYAYGQHAGPTLTRNLAALASSTNLQFVPHAAAVFSLIACGDRRAIASWGKHSTLGRWPWWIKQWIDRRMVLRLTKSPP
ncbi:MAG: FAD-dependent oxidoreductase [Rhodoferax sp.]|nr:FAD-dependent oxidoreductase [Rhodoferax sp.]